MLFEVDFDFDATGNYIGPWLDTAGIDRVRIGGWSTGTTPAVTIEESIDATWVHVTRSVNLSAVAEFGLVGKYARIRATGGSTGGDLVVLGRVVKD